MKNNTPSSSFRSYRLSIVIILLIVAALGAVAIRKHDNTSTSAKPVAEHDFEAVWNNALEGGKTGMAIRWGEVSSPKWGTVIPGTTFHAQSGPCRSYSIRTVTDGVTSVEYGRACRTEGEGWKKVE